MVFNKRTQETITGRIQEKGFNAKKLRLLMSYAIKLKSEGSTTDVTDTFGRLKRKVSGQKFKDMARKGW